MIWRYTCLRHVFSKDVSDLLLAFYEDGPYDEDICEYYWTLESLRVLHNKGEESRRRFQFLLFIFGCNRETWINDFHHIFPILEYRWVVIRSHWVQPFSVPNP